ncbi:hypothetical protein K470DRAFT_283713 [Piedraia hortae CBS 480.64]|uniref:Translation machinery-associated protein 16 n=1 Tax=Piedraia hortae CBS 480.64 TaxID=1314780 RepID=A0A6A7BRA8_9PEZI|nr:hypothetical protein K470DRAFT_283713 [Piedraia hortae CBS 480.64]
MAQLNKVQKSLQKKKKRTITALHPKSRDAHRLSRAQARDDRVAKTVSARQKANRPWLERVEFFQSKILPAEWNEMDLDDRSTGDARSLIKEFIARHDDELASLQKDRRPGRPPAQRQVLLEQQKERETSEFKSGFWVPDLLDQKTREKLMEWKKNDWLGLSNLNFKRVDDEGKVRESDFPPKGAE